MGILAPETEAEWSRSSPSCGVGAQCGARLQVTMTGVAQGHMAVPQQGGAVAAQVSKAGLDRSWSTLG